MTQPHSLLPNTEVGSWGSFQLCVLELSRVEMGRKKPEASADRQEG